jgi:hypothetical protein
VPGQEPRRPAGRTATYYYTWTCLLLIRRLFTPGWRAGGLLSPTCLAQLLAAGWEG